MHVLNIICDTGDKPAHRLLGEKVKIQEQQVGE